jgi:hypothetical protein
VAYAETTKVEVVTPGYFAFYGPAPENGDPEEID